MVFTGSRSAGRRSGSNRTTQRHKQLAAKSNRGDFTDQYGGSVLLFFLQLRNPTGGAMSLRDAVKITAGGPCRPQIGRPRHHAGAFVLKGIKTNECSA